MKLTMVADARLTPAAKDLIVEVVPGSNDGCYIDLKHGEAVILSYRYASHGPGDRVIKEQVDHLKAYFNL